MEYTIKLSESKAKELREEAILFGIDDIGEFVLEKMKATIRWEESESIRNLMQEKILSVKEKNTLKEFGKNYFEDLHKAKVVFDNEEFFVISLKSKLKENKI